MLAIGKTSRSSFDQELINYEINSGDNCSIKAIGSDGPILFNIEFELKQDIKNSNSSIEDNKAFKYKKILKINGAKVSLNSFVGVFNVVMFEANDLMLIFGAPILRRRFLDILISQTDIQYLKALQRYNQVIKNRNRILKNISLNNSNYNELKFWTDKLIEDGSMIMYFRHKIIQNLFQRTSILYDQLSIENETLEIIYHPNLKYSDDIDLKNQLIQKNDYEKFIFESIERKKNDELRYGTSLVGPHRDDLDIKLSGFNISNYASRGQIRSIVLALKLAEAEIISEIKESDPVIILDDVMSEMDSDRRRLVLQLINNYDQVLITVPDKKLLDQPNLKYSKLFNVNKGKINIL